MLEKITRLTEEDETLTDDENTVERIGSQMESDTTSSRAGDSTTVGSDRNSALDEGSAIGFDQIFGLLKNHRRRDVLRYLTGKTKQIRHGELSEWIAARECGKDVSQITSKERKRVYVGLYQCHLPKMADIGAITYNQQQGTVKRGQNFDLFEHYLPDDEDTIEPTNLGHNWVQSVKGFIT